MLEEKRRWLQEIVGKVNRRYIKLSDPSFWKHKPNSPLAYAPASISSFQRSVQTLEAVTKET